jgi:hypothetical protein
VSHGLERRCIVLQTSTFAPPCGRKRHRRLDEKKVPWQEMAMTKIKGLCIDESLVGEGNEVVHIDLILGSRGRALKLPLPTV